MKILIASAAFYPENSPRSFRASELAKEFVKQGHEVTLITIDTGTELDVFCRTHSIRLKKLSPRKLRPIQIGGNRVPSIFWRIVNRVLFMLIEYPDIELAFKYRKILRSERNYDLLISIAVPYPVHWGTAWAQKERGQIAKIWVADCGDPYMGNKVDSFRKLFYFKYVEKWFCKKTDFIAITNIQMKDNYYPEFHNKIVEITQGFNFEESRKLLPPYSPNRVPTFAYVGTFIEGFRDPRALLDHLVNLPVEFKFYIYTPQRYLIEPYLERGRGRIELKDTLPRIELLSILKKMDFLVNISYDVKVQSPSKLIDYYLVGRPVLSLLSNEVNEGSIQQFLDGNYAQQFQFDNYEKFEIQNVSRKFLALLGNHERLESR